MQQINLKFLAQKKLALFNFWPYTSAFDTFVRHFDCGILKRQENLVVLDLSA